MQRLTLFFYFKSSKYNWVIKCLPNYGPNVIVFSCIYVNNLTHFYKKVFLRGGRTIKQLFKNRLNRKMHKNSSYLFHKCVCQNLIDADIELTLQSWSVIYRLYYEFCSILVNIRYTHYTCLPMPTYANFDLKS